jgi:hypothetical protein
LKLQAAPGETPAVQPPGGLLVALKLTAPVNPFSGVTVIVEIADCPALTVKVDGLADIENGAATFTATEPDDVALIPT